MRLEIKIGKTGKQLLQLANAYFFAYLGLVFAYRINYNNPSSFDPYTWQFVAMVFVGFVLVKLLGSVARDLGVRA